MVTIAAGPRLEADGLSLGAVLVGIEMMRRTLNKHAPALTRLSVEVIDLESDPVLGVSDADAGPQVFLRRASGHRAEHNHAVMKHVVDRQHCQVELAGEAQP